MRRITTIILLLALSASIAAQERPIAGTTIQTTDTSANSALIGCAVGSTTCTGGIKAGPITGSTLNLTGTLTGVAANLSGLLSVTGFGTHLFSTGGTGGNGLRVRNTTAGTGNYSILELGNDALADNLYIQSFSSTFTTSGRLVAAGALLEARGAGGLSISASDAAGDIRFYSGATPTLRFQINDAGDWLKGSNVMDSTGTPTVNSGFRTGNSIVGTDYAFTVNVGTSGGSATSGTVNFGHTWTTAPVCVAQSYFSDVTPAVMASAVAAANTTQVQISFTSTSSNFMVISVLCRSY